VLTEGRNRQIRRMMMAVGSRVHTLHRTRVGPLARLDDQAEGTCRRLFPAEVEALRLAISGQPRRPPSRDRAR
jgi:16S rRNA pseudouridine516 synthase